MSSHTAIHPCMSHAAVHPLYICMSLYTSIFSHTSICSSCVMGTLGTSVHDYVIGTLGGYQYICLKFLCLSVHLFAPQFIMVIQVTHHLCGSLPYWTRGLWMYAQLHAVDLFFLCSVLIMFQASATTAMTTTPPVTLVYSGTSSLLTTITRTPLLDWDYSDIRSA